MDHDEHSYSYDDNSVTSFGNDDASFHSYNEYQDNNNHVVYELTTAYNNNEHYISFDDASISLTQYHQSIEYNCMSLSDDDILVTNERTIYSIPNNKSCGKMHDPYTKSDNLHLK